MTIIIQQDTTEYILFTSVNCSSCFGWYFTHHQELSNTVATVSENSETCTATCRERGWAAVPGTVDTVL